MTADLDIVLESFLKQEEECRTNIQTLEKAIFVEKSKLAKIEVLKKNLVELNQFKEEDKKLDWQPILREEPVEEVKEIKKFEEPKRNWTLLIISALEELNNFSKCEVIAEKIKVKEEFKTFFIHYGKEANELFIQHLFKELQKLSKNSTIKENNNYGNITFGLKRWTLKKDEMKYGIMYGQNFYDE